MTETAASETAMTLKCRQKAQLPPRFACPGLFLGRVYMLFCLYLSLSLSTFVLPFFQPPTSPHRLYSTTKFQAATYN